MKKITIALFLTILMTSCGGNSTSTFKANDYGAFLGRSAGNDSGFENYSSISFEFDEFSASQISSLNDKGIKTFAYLNVGSLETYRSYYERFKDLTFKDYDDWPDERWIDVSDKGWQNFVINDLAKSFKDKGAFGVYMDNVDVYSICKEENKSLAGVESGIKNIISGVNSLGLNIMVNGGAEFLDDMFDKDDDIFSKIYAYHQEEVFSLIKDYERNIFGKQEKTEEDYYCDIAVKMKNKGINVYFLEYTKDKSLIEKIDNYCKEKEYHYYVSSKIELD